FVRSNRALPVRIDDRVVVVAAAGPLAPGAIAELEGASGREVQLVLAPAGDIERAIDRSYDALRGLDRVVAAFSPDATRAGTVTLGAEVIDDQAPVVQVFQRILTQAVRERASDIHIEPQDSTLRVRFRVDGALHEAAHLPMSMAQSLVSRIKILADMNIVERR